MSRVILEDIIGNFAPEEIEIVENCVVKPHKIART